MSVSSLIIPQLILWQNVSAVNSPAKDIFTFFFHANERTFKGQIDVIELDKKGIVVAIQLYLNISGEDFDLEAMSKRIKEISPDPSLKISDDDRIIFKVITKKLHLAVIGVMEHADKNHLERFEVLTIKVTEAVERFVLDLLGRS